ncbi:MAG TPA: hypothetical protein VF796_30020 [Humisphaera sp.]
MLKWWVAPVLVVLLHDSHGSHVAKFWIARPALEARMAELATAPAPPPREGLEWPDGAEDFGNTHRLPGGAFRFRELIGHPFDWNGFAYSPTPLPAERDGFTYEHIVGPWYVCFGY